MKKHLTIRLEEETIKQLKVYCIEKGTTITDLITECINKTIKEEKGMLRVIYTDTTDNNKRYIVAEITTNHSMDIDQALEFAGVNMDDWAKQQGCDGYDYESLTME